MKVLAFSDHLSQATSGGAERVAAEVYGRLAQEPGIDLTVVTVLRRGQDAMTVPGAEVVSVAGRDLSRYVGAELLVAPGVGRQAAALCRQLRPDVLHANGLHFHGSAVAARIARRTGIPLVTTAHLGDLSALSLRLRAGGTVWDATVGSWIVRSSRRLVAVSQAVAEHLTRLGATPDTVRLAPNGVDHATYHARGRLALGSHGELRAVFVGRLIANKGPAVALEAVAGARASGCDVRLSVLGDGPLRARLEARARDRDLAGAVTFHGHVDNVADHLRASDVLLRPSFTEGQPLAVLEAMACGLPVICSTIPGNTEVVRHDHNGWHTAPGSGEMAGRALAIMASDRARLRRMGAAAATVAAGHSWDRSAAVHAAGLRAVSPSFQPVTVLESLAS